MHDPDEHDLVFQALTSGLSGCVIWKRNAREWVRGRYWDPRDVVHGVAGFLKLYGPEALRQKPERRDSLGDPKDNFYDVVFPYADLRNGLYLEVVLQVPDGETSVVKIVSIHEQDARASGRKGWR